MKYRKKPVVIEAVQWTGENHAEMCEFIDPEVLEIKPKEGVVIRTLEGEHHASPGDYIIKGVNGEFYPCKPGIFVKTYESAALSPPNEPLTQADLDSMDYDKVWIDYEDGTGEWALVCNGYIYSIDTLEGAGLDFVDYMRGERLEHHGYKAYRRPPEGEANA